MRFLHAFPRVAAPAALALALLAAPAPSGAQLAPLGPQFQVNPLAPLANEAFASVASDAAGNFVVVWRQVLPGVDAYGIHARLYDALGNPLSGPIQIHQQPASVATEAAVAMDEEGNFVVAWTSSSNPGDLEAPPRVVARWFDRTGTPRSGEVVVGDGSFPDVAMRGVGGVAVVVWQKVVDGRSFVFLRGYSFGGVAVEPEIQVSEEPSASPVHPRVDRSPSGAVAVVWQEDDPEDSVAVATVKLRILSGGLEVGPVEVAGQAEVQDRPDVVFGKLDQVFVVWRRANGIFGRLYDQTGEPLTGILKLDSGAPQFSSVAENPRVSSDGSGSFLAVWSNRVGAAAQVQDIYGRLLDAEGRLLGNEIRITTALPESDHQLRPDVAGLPAGFVVVWEDSFDKVLGQRLGQAGGALRFREAGIVVNEGAGSVTILVERGGQAGAVSVSYRTENGTAKAGEDYVATSGTLGWAAGDTVPKPITVPLINDRIQEDGRESFSLVLESPTGGATLGDPVRSTVTVVDDDGWPTALGGEVEAAASTEENWPAHSAVAMDPLAPAGRFALAWVEDFPLGPQRILGRIYSGAETPSGSVFELGSGQAPALAWSAQGLTAVWLGSEAIEGRRISNGGTPLGAPFQISGPSRPTSSFFANSPAIAVNRRGDAVVVWQGFDPLNVDRFSADVFARRLGPAGQPAGGEIVVNLQRPGAQDQPDVAMGPDGSFVVVWRGPASNLATVEIFARLFNSDGTPRGPEFRVNTTNRGDEMTPSVAVDASGNFLVVWVGESSSSAFHDMFGQFFDAQGRKVGGEFRVNTYTDQDQVQPRVEAMTAGGFVVVWASGFETPHSLPGPVGQDGDLLGIFGQRYDGQGRRVGAEFPVNLSTVGNQQFPDLATGPGGRFVVTWTSFAKLDTIASDFDVRIMARSFTSAFQCQPSATTMCLNNGRFQVRTRWRTADGQQGEGQAEGLSHETGFFWFFGRENVEMIVKALDGCGVNQRFWVFAGGLTDVEVEMEVTDTSTGAVRTYLNPRGNAFLPIQDTSAFPTCDVSGPGDPLPPIPEPTACGGAPAAIALAGGRFRVDVEWGTSDGTTGRGQGVQLTPDTGYFCFFDTDNVELVVKVLNGCPVNQRYWVFSGGLTDVEVRMTVTDTLRGETRVYTNPRGRAFQPVQDTSAFATCQ
ncbi:MAG TPA: Calx-beta domain-containing protein [Thermoanaerobaculia bacterium]|nr:Calx-beta domain-containing protein [Thermoanaerobaculia bacterium]